MRLRLLVVAGLILPLAAGCSQAGLNSGTPPSSPRTAGPPIRVEGTWASAAGNQASVYFILSNHGSTADTLTGASSPVAAGALLKSGSKTIRRLPLPASSEISFDGTTYGVSLKGLRRPLVSGDTVRVTLTFAQADPVTFVAGVR